MLISTNSLGFNSTHYSQVFNKNLVVGYQVATATAASDIINAPPLHMDPCSNRVINLGFYNALQDVFFQRINSEWKNKTDNFFYSGTLQTLKFISGLVIRGMMQDLLYKGNKVNELTKFTDTFIGVTTGMTVFFGVGAIESKISSENMKIQYISTLCIPLFMGFIFFSPFETKLDTKTNAVHLSLNDLFLTHIGLIGSYVVPDVMHRIGIDQGGKFESSSKFLFETSVTTAVTIISNYDPTFMATSLLFNSAVIDPLLDYIKIEEMKIFDYNLLNIASLTILAAVSMAQGDITTSMARVAGFTVAKAVAATGVEIIYDYKDDICAYSLKPLCEYIGIIDHQNAEIL